MTAVLVALALAAAAPASCGSAVDNRALITRFADLLYTRKQVQAAFETYVAPDYIQHNPGIADGRDAAVAALSPMFARADRAFHVQRILVDGDLAAIHLRVDAPTPPGTKGAAVVDIYRLRCGRIVEHWDVLQTVPVVSANPHPAF